MKNSFKLAIVTLVIAVSAAACGGEAKKDVVDSTSIDSTITKTTTVVDSTKKDTVLVVDTTKKDTTKK
ncbi:hypothetical protein [Mucilaginibacter sp.]|uniref:hypothetical protein n=1 Tax=Mucilaginibacter sp. TaxID=1882438 RepID=UPI0032662DB8